MDRIQEKNAMKLALITVLLLLAAPAQGEPSKGMQSNPLKFSPTAKVDRLKILSQERTEITTELADAINGLNTAKDKTAQQNDILRLQQNLKAINAEIGQAQKQVPTFISTEKVAQPTTPKTEVVAVSNQTESAPQAASNTPSAANYAEWDVFRNFNNKGN